jgi:hypothetical protein
MLATGEGKGDTDRLAVKLADLRPKKGLLGSSLDLKEGDFVEEGLRVAVELAVPGLSCLAGT